MSNDLRIPGAEPWGSNIVEAISLLRDEIEGHEKVLQKAASMICYRLEDIKNELAKLTEIARHGRP